jgi:glyoxylase-like metal-dependent hydrolase (beta-lactamase superfamily II)
VGHGSLDLLRQGEIPGAGTHACFDKALLRDRQVIELPPSEGARVITASDEILGWSPLLPFSAALDIFQDGSVYVIPSPAHLQGHMNLLCRIGDQRWVYLGGDTYHHVGLLNGTEQIGTWTDDQGRTLCVHTDQQAAVKTFSLLRELKRTSKDDGVELEFIASHDAHWFAENQHRLFPNTLEG